MINYSIPILDFSNFSLIFVPIFSHWNIISDKFGVLSYEISEIFYLASSIFVILACFGLVTIPLVFFAGRAGKILDTAAKIIVIAAGSSNLYKNHGGGSNSNDDKDKDKDKEDKDTDKDKDKDKTNDDKKDNETKKTTESNSDSNSASK